MQRYNPIVAPNPDEWLALDEQERINLARDYHRKAPSAERKSARHSARNGRDTNRARRRNARVSHRATVDGPRPRPA